MGVEGEGGGREREKTNRRKGVNRQKSRAEQKDGNR